VSAISGFCEKCNKFRKRHCDGNRNTCMSILFDTIEALQQENEQLRAQLDEWKYEVKCHMDEVIAREKQIEQLRAHVAREGGQYL
jgi:predicted RNase H-like nuclease (RuvC/YqgF family)